jgi:hypothetical protein
MNDTNIDSHNPIFRTLQEMTPVSSTHTLPPYIKSGPLHEKPGLPHTAQRKETNTSKRK